jgi:hypothetical protein
MLQLLHLARENAALKCELARIRDEAEALQRLLGQASTEVSHTETCAEDELRPQMLT